MSNQTESRQIETLCSIEEVAKSCCVTKQTVRNWMDRGMLPPAIRIGERCLRWRAADISAWLTSNQAPITKG